MKGGVLKFEMADVPAKNAFTEFPAATIDISSVAVPLIEGGGRVFKGRTTVSLKTTTPDTKIFYTTDGREPTEKSTAHTVPLTVDATSTVKAIAVNSKGEKSLMSEAEFYKKPNDWTVSIASKYNRQYTGGGDEGLIDGIRGTVNFASGEWQGYQGHGFGGTIDLQKETIILKVGGGCFQVLRSGAWLATAIWF